MGSKKDPYHILFEDRQLGPFPMHRLKRVDSPTSLITDNVQRIDARDRMTTKAIRDEHGVKGNTQPPYPISSALMEVTDHLNTVWDKKVIAEANEIQGEPEIMSRHIKQLGYFLKADIMGICRLPQSAIYSHDERGNPIDIDYPFAIVIVMKKEPMTINASTGYDWIGTSLSFQAYQHLALVAHTMTGYIRKLGYRAAPQTITRYQVLIPPLLVWAGIGEGSRAGIVLNPFLGLGYKAAAILTDLPLIPDKPIDFGLQDFCRNCNICAEMCPSKAISSGDKVMYNGYETWKLDTKRCATFNTFNQKGTMCGRCVKVCPWNRPATLPNNMVRWGVEHSGLARRVAIKADHIMGRDKGLDGNQWWFNLEGENGFLKIPTSNERNG